MSYPRIFERVYMSPLCIHPTRFASIHAFLLPRMLGQQPLEMPTVEQPVQQPQAGQVRPNRSMFSGRRRQKAGPAYLGNGQYDSRFYDEPREGVASIPLYGAVAKNLSAWEESCGGGTDINAFEMALRQARAANDIHTIVLDIDSPGGSATGIAELGSLIRSVAAEKTVYAYTDSTMCSAAYWLGSQAAELYVSGSATVGSIGTYIAWLDPSIKMEMEGIALRLYAEGEHKGMGLPGRPMSEADEQHLRDTVREINDSFTGAVTDARPGVEESTMQGQSFTGRRAVDLGLADAIVPSFEELLDLIDS
ncbi:S49 family peptidase [Coraliomargarita sp. SDUM461003]|uniref:S49 family peptidase n=1 Tax=Thalassobacterium maritimum TaxID=3041265 RepID=A0ABU1AQ20_9BACT|nr:S49 family peptidase [Coraliomargarita sp. SDUM461003]MDQ8206211.1 S49 family peptidase [Coraliomargarita sp. SDUM461003]